MGRLRAAGDRTGCGRRAIGRLRAARGGRAAELSWRFFLVGGNLRAADRMYPGVSETATITGELEMSARHRLLLPLAAILFVLAACDSTPIAAPHSAAPPSSAPTSSARGSIGSAPTTADPVTPATSRAVAPTKSAGGVKCPSAKALEKLVDLPKGWYFVPSSVECWKGWATVDPEGPTPGDGVYLFRYKSSTGWRYHSQGSGYDCKDLGINEPAPFCQYP